MTSIVPFHSRFETGRARSLARSRARATRWLSRICSMNASLRPMKTHSERKAKSVTRSLSREPERPSETRQPTQPGRHISRPISGRSFLAGPVKYVRSVAYFRRRPLDKNATTRLSNQRPSRSVRPFRWGEIVRRHIVNGGSFGVRFSFTHGA